MAEISWERVAPPLSVFLRTCHLDIEDNLRGHNAWAALINWKVVLLSRDLKAELGVGELGRSPDTDKMQAQVAKQPHRRRSPSDPFADIYSHRATHSSTAPPTSPHSPPPVPPKSSPKPNRHHVSTSMNRDNVVDAVRDTVTVRHVDQPRTRMGRSQTQMPPYVPSSLLAGSSCLPSSRCVLVRTA